LFFQLIEQEINPFVDEWEAAGQFPAHEVFRKLGKAGFLGVNKPTGKALLFSLMCYFLLPYILKFDSRNSG